MSLKTSHSKLPNNLSYLNEGFFLYWKSPRQNWDKIILGNPSKKYLIIPINWALHVVNGKVHFGDGSDELSLESLIRLGVEHGKKVILSVAITPNPLLENGGVPLEIDGDLSFSSSGFPKFFSPNSKDLLKVRSFYSPEVFKEFSKFLKSFGKFLSYIDLPYDVASTEYVSFSQSGICHSLIEDFGPAQVDSFEKFKQHAGDEANAGFLETMILDLYEESIKENCQADFIGRLKVNILGTRNEDSINNVFNSIDQVSFNKSLINCFKNNIYPISIDSITTENDLLSRQYESLMSSSYIEDCLRTSSLTNDKASLSMISHLSFFHGKRLDQYRAKELISKTLEVVDKSLGFSSSSKLYELTKLEIDEGVDSELIYLVGSSFKDDEVGLIKKLFFSGKKIIFDTNGVSDSFLSEFKLNFCSKEIKKSKLNLEVDLFIYELGTAVMILFDSSHLFSRSTDTCQEFWNKIIYAAEIDFLKMSGVEDIDYIWRKRPIRSNELNFEEIRRLNIFNPHNEEKTIVLEPSERFFLLKKVDEFKAILNRRTSRELMISLSPKGSVGIEFGVVE